jgi:hypothetical protein
VKAHIRFFSSGFRRRSYLGINRPSSAEESLYLVDETWSGATAPTVTPSAIMDSGNVDIEGSFVASSNNNDASTFDFFSAATPDGTLSLRYSSLNWIWRVRGSDVITVQQNFPTSSRNLAWRVGDRVSWRAWYRVGTGQAGVRITVNGVTAPDTTASTTGGALSAPTAVTLGTVAQRGDPQTFRARFLADVPTTVPVEIVVLGDSTVGSWTSGAQPSATGLISVVHDLYTSGERTSRPGIGLLAVASDTTDGQKTKWDASPWNALASLKAVIIQSGINDRNIYTATQEIGRWQILVDAIRATVPGACKIFASKMTPIKGHLDAFGEGALYASYWVPVNDGIAGVGATNVTGVDGRITSHATTLNDGSGALAAPYDFDLIHENNAGRAVVAAAYRTALVSAGVLP